MVLSLSTTLSNFSAGFGFVLQVFVAVLNKVVSFFLPRQERGKVPCYCHPNCCPPGLLPTEAVEARAGMQTSSDVAAFLSRQRTGSGSEEVRCEGKWNTKAGTSVVKLGSNREGWAERETAW